MEPMNSNTEQRVWSRVMNAQSACARVAQRDAQDGARSAAVLDEDALMELYTGQMQAAYLPASGRDDARPRAPDADTAGGGEAVPRKAHRGHVLCPDGKKAMPRPPEITVRQLRERGAPSGVSGGALHRRAVPALCAQCGRFRLRA